MKYTTRIPKSILCAIVSIIFTITCVKAQEQDLADMSIEELMNISVTSVSKKATPLSESAAAITVITADDMKQIGANSIPEALRIVPGLSVARINSSNWAISSRGFQDQFANKLLVLIDGRSVYTPFFAGVFWNHQDFALEDLDRIEVIRGPGATLWGTNAVNGVINIISKNAKDTQGGILSTSVSSIEEYQATARYGGKISDNLFYRVYTKHKENGHFELPNEANAPDDWRITQTGFRMDWEPKTEKSITLQGDFYLSEQGTQLSEPNLTTPPFNNDLTVFDYNSYGGNLLGRFQNKLSDTDEFELQTYYNREYLDLNQFEQTIDTIDVDSTYRFQASESHDIVAGLGYRFISDQFTDSALLELNPKSQTHQLFSAFIQDEISLYQDKVRITLGSKFEHNDYTGFEIQPSGQALWQVTETQTLWSSISRAVHTPARVEQDSRFNRTASATPFSPSLVSIVGSSRVDSEKLTAYEIGYRNNFNPTLSLELSAFYNDYDNLPTTVAGTPFLETVNGITRLLVPQYRRNSDEGSVFGVETSIHWASSKQVQWSVNYSWLKMDIDTQGSNEASPQQQFNLRNHWQMTEYLAMDNVCYYVDQISNSTTGLNIPAYFRWDLGFTWDATANLELSLWAQNILEDQHQEFASTLTELNYETPRSLTLKAIWKF